MPLVIKDEAIPQSLVAFNKWLNRVLFSLNVIIPLSELPFLLVAWKMSIKNKGFQGKKVTIGLNAIQALLWLLEIVSGVFLIVALLKIRKFLKNTGQSNMLDSSMTLRYVATFGFFLTALLISTAVTDFFYFAPGNYYEIVVYSSYIFVEACNVASQALLAFLLLKLTKEEEDVEESEEMQTEEPLEFTEVAVEPFDEHADMQSKMWNQFMRK